MTEHEDVLSSGLALIEVTMSGHGIELPEREALEQRGKGEGWMVTVYNNDVNTYDEVMMVLMLATNCTSEEAYIEAWEIDHYGLCIVHRADETECRGAADVIGAIGIRVEVSPES